MFFQDLGSDALGGLMRENPKPIGHRPLGSQVWLKCLLTFRFVFFGMGLVYRTLNFKPLISIAFML